MLKDMNRREFLKVSAATGVVLVAGNQPLTFAEEIKPIQSTKPPEW